MVFLLYYLKIVLLFTKANGKDKDYAGSIRTKDKAFKMLFDVYFRTSRPISSSICRSLRMVAHAVVVSIFPVIVADAPDRNAISPSFVSSALPAARRISAFGLI